MQLSRRWLGVVVAGVAACGDDGGDPVDVNGTGGDCLFEDERGRSGFRYQCEGDIVIDVEVEGPFDGSPATSSMPLAFGHSVREDSYDEPHVMACCPELDAGEPECEQGHQQACMVDLAKQGCKSLETNTRDFADERFGGPGLQNAIARTAVNKIADHVRDHQGDCIRAFVTDTDVGTMPPTCDPDGTGVEYDSLLETGQWSFDPDGLVTRVTISVASASYDGVHPVSGMPDTCDSAEDNDTVLFFQVDPKQGSRRLTLASGTAALHGPQLGVLGVAELESAATGCAAEHCSKLAIAVDHAERTASLEDLQLRLAGTAEVGDPSAAIPVDAFVVRLWDATRAALDRTGATATIPPGGAWFVISAASGEARGVVSATNETAIVLHEEAGGWTSSAFTIARRDALGGRWALVVMPSRWE